MPCREQIEEVEILPKDKVIGGFAESKVSSGSLMRIAYLGLDGGCM